MMLKAVLIDDEPDSVRLLALQLQLYCPFVSVVAACTDSRESLIKIKALQPDLIFLDIEMPVMNGFELLEALGSIESQVIFVTAYDQFAIRAFRYSALDYLLKPIDADDLQAAVGKAERAAKTEMGQIQMLRQQLGSGVHQLPEKIALPYQNGVVFVELNKVMYCEADNNYTRFVMQDGKQYVVAKTLGSVQQILEYGNFLRVHRQYLVNLDLIVKYVKGEGNYLVMPDQKNIPVSRSNKQKLIERFGWL